MYNEFYTPLHAFQTASNGFFSGLKDAFNSARNNYSGPSHRSNYVSPIPILVSADRRQKSIMDDIYKNDRELFERCYKKGEKAGIILTKFIP